MLQDTDLGEKENKLKVVVIGDAPLIEIIMLYLWSEWISELDSVEEWVTLDLINTTTTNPIIIVIINWMISTNIYGNKIDINVNIININNDK